MEGGALRNCFWAFSVSGRELVPHLAVVAFNVVLIILILIFVRFRAGKSFAKAVNLALDVLIVLLLMALILICFRFSAF
jgi:preprotein translocase subunit SecF